MLKAYLCKKKLDCIVPKDFKMKFAEPSVFPPTLLICSRGSAPVFLLCFCYFSSVLAILSLHFLDLSPVLHVLLLILFLMLRIKLFFLCVHSAQSNDEDYVQWELHLERSSQELIPHGCAGSLQGRQELHCLTVSQWPLWGPVHAHHWGFSPQSLQHSRRHVSARHLGYFWESSFPCHEETFHTHRLEDYIGTFLS